MNKMKIEIEFLSISDKEQDKDYVLFKNGEEAFLLAHGSEEGTIQLKNKLYTPQQVAHLLLQYQLFR